MTDHIKEAQMIAKQAMEIDRLTTELTERNAVIDEVRQILYCIGGPLNGSRIPYAREQLKPFFNIAKATEL